DDHFSQVFSNSVFSRLVCRVLDLKDLRCFVHFFEENKIYHKLDFSIIKNVTTFSDDILMIPTIVLLELDENLKVFPRAIYADGKCISPDDQEWGLYKTYAVQNAQMRLLLSEHPKLHFPIDALVGSAQCLLDHDSVLYKLISPHFYMQLPLNFAVLYISKSVGLNSQNEIYTPFCNNKNGLIESLKGAYLGLPDNSAYPEYQYRLSAPNVFGVYGAFLEKYWDVFYEFVNNVLSHCAYEDENIKSWSRYLAAMIPGFPGEDRIFEGDNLVCAITSFILNVSVEHSCDHYSYNLCSRTQMPLRLRKSNEHNFKNFLMRGEDLFRHELANEMFFKCHTLVTLLDTHYSFSSEIQCYVNKFKIDLSALDKSLEKEELYIPLSQMACSIQF
ncbi:MAG: hypothetical protein Q7U04_05295, partial [Bacteriovorax sp.]|nr:hypothetical protein [Bacteriovorax sp.]